MAKVKKAEQPDVIKVTLVRSLIGRPPDQRTTVATLGLRRVHQTVEVADTPSNRG
ncbi:50S ribosomal protein L30, partial [Escherichia coli]|uniref:50S ribosomal protein L30 n=1 Tax=Escherichia coli TaxID=562 RepID=UPI0013653E40